MIQKRKALKELPTTKIMDVELRFEEGRLIGWVFIAKDEEGTNIIDGLIAKSIPGLIYREDRMIRPHTGGEGKLHIIFPSNQIKL